MTIAKSMKKQLLSRLYRKGILKDSRIKIAGKQVKFENIGHSNLLVDIFSDSLSAFEPEMVEFFLSGFFDYEYIIDAGSNTGILSACAELGNPKAKVISLEPVKQNFDYINRFREINNFQFQALNTGLSGTSKQDIIFIPYGRNSSKISATASLINSFKGTTGAYSNLDYKEEIANFISLDALQAKYLENYKANETPTLIKLDCEGAELDILSNTNLLSCNCTDFIVEIMINDKDKNDIFNLFEESGFQGYLMTPASLVYEDRPLTLPMGSIKNRTIFRNHFFTKKDRQTVNAMSRTVYGNVI